MYDLIRPLLFSLDAETAHGLTLYAVDVAERSGLSRWVATPPADLPVRVFGIDFPNPVGLAAGLDKNGEHLDGLAAMGFGFVEIGTVTPRAQPGNDKPRMFRLPHHEAVINRLGFNNAGIDTLVRNVQKSRFRGVLGINIGKNKDTPNERAIDDYLYCLERAYPLATYITVNISSPNTQGLRDLQEEDTLRRFIGTLRESQEQLAARHGVRKPMVVKIAPDLADAELDAMAEVLLASGIDGVICTNTTIDRDTVAGDPQAHQTGGLSGRPLFAKSTSVLRGMVSRVGSRLPIIGVGGIMDGDTAAEKLEAGASLIQVYSGLVYRGPKLITEAVAEIRRRGVLA